MNDEELRAFLDSATVGDDDHGDDHEAAPERPADPAAQREGTPEQPAPTAEPAARRTPSFDELMAFGAPGDDEELVPLILPGFSSEPKAKPLPPVFRAESQAPSAAPSQPAEPARPAVRSSTPATSEPKTPSEDPEATQPYDTIPKAAQRPAPSTPAVRPRPAASQPPTAPLPAAPAAAASAPTAPVSKPAAPAQPAEEDPFAALSLGAASNPPGDDERISVVGGEPRRRALPWIIVGGGAVIAIIASIFIINGVRGGEDPVPSPSTPSTSEQPVETEQPTSEPSPSEEPEPEPDAGDVPQVDVGPSIYPIPITQWGITVDKSQKLGSVNYTEQGDSVMFDITLAQSLPESCAAARQGWGLRKLDDGKLEVIRPEPRCSDTDAAAVYDEIWGLMDHMAKSARAS